MGESVPDVRTIVLTSFKSENAQVGKRKAGIQKISTIPFRSDVYLSSLRLFYLFFTLSSPQQGSSTRNSACGQGFSALNSFCAWTLGRRNLYLHHHVFLQSPRCKFAVEQPCNHLQTYTEPEISVKTTIEPSNCEHSAENVRPDLLFSLKRQERTMNSPLSMICAAGLTTGTSIISSLPCIETFSSFSKTAARCFCKRQIAY